LTGAARCCASCPVGALCKEEEEEVNVLGKWLPGAVWCCAACPVAFLCKEE
jgi:Fe-S-cluster-containing dehydrogenase component